MCSKMNEDIENKLEELNITSLIEHNMDKALIEESSDDDDDDDQPVTLGFVETPKNSWSLLPHMFPSIAGGTPAWLEPNNLPSGTSYLCGFCGQPLQFLLQVYAPLSEKESTFHRMLYVFMCPSMACLLRDQHEQCKMDYQMSSRSVRVFRCQLPRSNSFYSSNPPRNDGTDKPLTTGAELCCWCGTWRGNKVCGSCKKARYCSKIHQAAHWQSSHKTDCRRLLGAPVESSSSMPGANAEVEKGPKCPLWKQFEIVTEEECDSVENFTPESAAPLVARDQVDESLESVMSNFEGDDNKKHWAAFQERISWAPEQVLRYYRCGKAKPLWPMSSGRPQKLDNPKCVYCGCPRTCEFQVLPQLLYYFGVENEVDSLDWATIVVYTCENSCDGSVVYKEEFPWVQLLSQVPASKE